MNPVRRMLEAQFARMKPGDHVNVNKDIFHQAYPIYGWPFEIYNTSEEKFLSGMMGSSFGTWRVSYDGFNQHYIVSHHEVLPYRVSVDPDRIYMYDKLPSGELVLKGEYQ